MLKKEDYRAIGQTNHRDGRGITVEYGMGSSTSFDLDIEPLSMYFFFRDRFDF
jgi:hypothetical protein